MPHVALLENTLAVRQHGMTTHIIIDNVTLDPDLHHGITQGLSHTMRHVEIPTQQQYH
jgi:hypothetical protein